MNARYSYYPKRKAINLGFIVAGEDEELALPELTDEKEWECPQCGSTEGTPVEFDFGTSSETGYHDAGEACTRCIGGGK